MTDIAVAMDKGRACNESLASHVSRHVLYVHNGRMCHGSEVQERVSRLGVGGVVVDLPDIKDRAETPGTTHSHKQTFALFPEPVTNLHRAETYNASRISTTV